MDRLDAAAMALPGVRVTVLQACPSTNSMLLEDARLEPPVLLAAEEQTAGRGRRGRRWHSAPGRDVTFSLAHSIARPARELAALSLVAGVAATRALRRLGVVQAALKWPNDLVAGGAKLGGILVETRRHAGTTLAVIGIGINYRHDAGLARRLRRQVACVADLVAVPPSRNVLIREVARELLEALGAFEARGLDAVRHDWLALHAHAGHKLRVRLDDGRRITGIAAGLAEDGALELETRAGRRAVRSGRVLSARAA